MSLELTDAEKQVAEKLLEGYTYREIVAALDRNEDTVRQHVQQLYEKCGVSEDSRSAKLKLVLFLHACRYLLGIRCSACQE
jgi:DNA-binding NarL/FixJ family response regulator